MKEHLDRLAEQASSKLPPTLRSVRESLSRKAKTEQDQGPHAAIAHCVPSSITALLGSRRGVVIVVGWRVDGSARCGQLHLLSVPLLPGKAEAVRSDVVVPSHDRRPSHAVINMSQPFSPALVSASSSSSSGASSAGAPAVTSASTVSAVPPPPPPTVGHPSLSRFPLSAVVHAPTVATWDFRKGPAMVAVEITIFHAVADGTGARNRVADAGAGVDGDPHSGAGGGGGEGNSGDGNTSGAEDGVSFRVAAVSLVVLATPSRNAVAGGSSGAALPSVGSTSPSVVWASCLASCSQHWLNEECCRVVW